MSVIYEFDYTGDEQIFNIPYTGIYQLEVWGAQGGSISNDGGEYFGDVNAVGGYGGYATGYISLTKDEKLYINVGGKGKAGNGDTIGIDNNNDNIPDFYENGYYGGYNGGGFARNNRFYSLGNYVGSGGGATHIARRSGLLYSLQENVDDVLIVAGGGAGIVCEQFPDANIFIIGNSGGGYYGGYGNDVSEAGTQISGYAFGTANADLPSIEEANTTYSGAGGGYYGGKIIVFDMYTNEDGLVFKLANGGGGSGYIGNSNLKNGYMVGYNVTESANDKTKTVSTTSRSETAITDMAKIGNGYVKITYYPETKYLVKHLSDIYTISNDNKLVKIDVDNLTANIFKEYGFDTPPNGNLLLDLINPEVLVWHEISEYVPQINAKIKAVPYPQTIISDTVNFTHPTVKAVENVAVYLEGNPVFACSIDNGNTWYVHNGTEWQTSNDISTDMATSILSGISTDQWEELLKNATGFIIRFTLNSKEDAVKEIIVNYIN